MKTSVARARYGSGQPYAEPDGEMIFNNVIDETHRGIIAEHII